MYFIYWTNSKSSTQGYRYSDYPDELVNMYLILMVNIMMNIWAAVFW